MRFLLRATVLAALMAACASQAIAQDSPSRTTGIAFFERARIGPVELTPIGIVRDQRCADPRFCYRPEDLRISVIVHQGHSGREVVLRLGKGVRVEGGFLVLIDPGTRHRERGALRLSEYALDILFVPAPGRSR